MVIEIKLRQYKIFYLRPKKLRHSQATSINTILAIYRQCSLNIEEPN